VYNFEHNVCQNLRFRNFRLEIYEVPNSYCSCNVFSSEMGRLLTQWR